MGFNCRLRYKGDTDRDKWLEFDYRIVWNLHGGLTHDSGWQKYTQGGYVITLAAPHRYREVMVDADPSILKDNNVRLVTVTFRSELLGKEQSRQISLKTGSSGSLSKVIEYAHTEGDYNYDYDIVWRVRGGERVTSGPQKGSDTIIFADELP